nr:immunoglobulin heavy chain junction region [Homo sapiens]
CASVVLGVW